jgi:hypothetical protein
LSLSLCFICFTFCLFLGEVLTHFLRAYTSDRLSRHYYNCRAFGLFDQESSRTFDSFFCSLKLIRCLHSKHQVNLAQRKNARVSSCLRNLFSKTLKYKNTSASTDKLPISTYYTLKHQTAAYLTFFMQPSF